MFNCPKGSFRFSSLPRYDKTEYGTNTHLISNIKFISCCSCKRQYPPPSQRDQFTIDIRTALSFLHPHKITSFQAQFPALQVGAPQLSWERGTPQISPWTTEQHSPAQPSIPWPRRAFCLDFNDLEKEAEATESLTLLQ